MQKSKAIEAVRHNIVQNAQDVCSEHSTDASSSSSPCQVTISPPITDNAPRITNPAKPNTPPSAGPKSPNNVQRRAQQNRMAQKAFRERKERYISGLECKIKELESQLDQYSRLQCKFIDLECENSHLRYENQQLRESVLNHGSGILAHQPQTSKTPIATVGPSFVDSWYEAPERHCYSESLSLNSLNDSFNHSTNLLPCISPQFGDQNYNLNEHSSLEMKFAFADMYVSYQLPPTKE